MSKEWQSPDDRARLLESIEKITRRHLGALNRLESHLGCAMCRGPLTDGRCPECQGVPGEQERD